MLKGVWRKNTKTCAEVYKSLQRSTKVYNSIQQSKTTVCGGLQMSAQVCKGLQRCATVHAVMQRLPISAILCKPHRQASFTSLHTSTRWCTSLMHVCSLRTWLSSAQVVYKLLENAVRPLHIHHACQFIQLSIRPVGTCLLTCICMESNTAVQWQCLLWTTLCWWSLMSKPVRASLETST